MKILSTNRFYKKFRGLVGRIGKRLESDALAAAEEELVRRDSNFNPRDHDGEHAHVLTGLALEYAVKRAAYFEAVLMYARRFTPIRLFERDWNRMVLKGRRAERTGKAANR